MRRKTITLLSSLLALDLLAAGAPAATDKPGTILKGEIPLVRFLEFLSVNRGVPVIFDSAELSRTSAQRTITIVNDTVATYEVVKAILEMNGFRVAEEVLLDGSTVIKVGTRTPQTTGTGPIIDLDRNDKTVKRVYRPDEIVTTIVDVKHASTREVVSVLRALFGDPRKSGIYISEVQGSSSVVVTGKQKHVDYVRRMTRSCGPGPKTGDLVELIDVADGVDVKAAAEVLTKALAAATGKSSTATRSRSEATRKEETLIVPDVRTKRLVAVTTTEEDLKLLRALLKDTRPDPTNPAGIRQPHIYRIKHGPASALAAKARQRLTEIAARRGGSQGSEASQSTHSASDPRAGEEGKPTAPSRRPSPPRPPRLTPYGPGKALLIQAEPHELRKILQVLKDIDRPPPKPLPAKGAPRAKQA